MMRRAMIKDIETLSILYRETIVKTEEKSAYRFINKFIKKNVLSNDVFVKELNGKIIGAYISEKNKFGDPYTKNKIPYTVYWLNQLMVFPEYQKHGYGKELMEHYFITGLEHKATSCKLVCRDNLLKYYKRLGFKIVDKGRMKRSERDHYIMEKVLIQ